MSGNLFTRDDTLFGICEGIGEEFGFHPNYLRVVLAAMLLWNAPVVIGAYVVLGVVLMLTRWLVPVRRAAVVEAPELPVAGNDAAEPALLLAA